MNPLPKLILAGAMIALAGTARAESVVNVTGPDESSTTAVPLTLDTKITFGAQGFDIADTEESVYSFAYADCTSISFKTGITGISSVDADQNQQLCLKENPVNTELEVLGHDGEPVLLTITSMAGQTVSRIAQWQGETVNVSNLSSGLYLLTINNQTIKFVKK